MENGLVDVAKEWEAGTFTIVPETDEDIHTANERRLGELIGTHISGKLHTGRSRNDQVATDCRMWLREQCVAQKDMILDLISVAVSRAENESDLIMPGYTHLQPAQPIRWGHWLLLHVSRWQRDVGRLVDAESRMVRIYDPATPVHF